MRGVERWLRSAYECLMRHCDIQICLRSEKIFIEADVGGTKYVADDPLVVDPVVLLSVQRLHYWLNYSLVRIANTGGREKPCELGDLQAIGWLLYKLLFSSERIRSLFERSYTSFVQSYGQSKIDGAEPDLRLRLQMVLDGAPEYLATLPWEFLFVPLEGNLERGFFFSGERTELILTRYSPDEALRQQLKPHAGKLRVLVIWSNPKGTGTLDEDSVGEIRDFSSSGHVLSVELKNPTYNTLRQKIEEVKPHIVHYIGHGEAGSVALCKGREDNDFEIGQEEPQLRWVTGRNFRALFNNHKPRLVFLNSCKGAASTSPISLNSTARDLVNARVPAVVAMQYSISNDDAAIFSREFYRQLGLGQSIDEAVKAGRVALGQRWPPWEHPRFGTPVLYLLCHDAIVIPPPEEPVAVAEVSLGQGGRTALPGGRVVPSPISLGEPSTAARAPQAQLPGANDTRMKHVGDNVQIAPIDAARPAAASLAVTAAAETAVLSPLAPASEPLPTPMSDPSSG